MAKKGKKKQIRKIELQLPSGTVTIRARAADTKAWIEKFVAYAGLQNIGTVNRVLDALYTKGKRDGAREAFGAIDDAVAAAKDSIPHREPGRPHGS